jgi:hypothetical protein
MLIRFPFISILPVSGKISLVIILNVVVLPEPLGPYLNRNNKIEYKKYYNYKKNSPNKPNISVLLNPNDKFLIAILFKNFFPTSFSTKEFS